MRVYLGLGAAAFLAAYTGAVHQWGKSSALADAAEAEKAAIIATVDEQISILNERVQMRENRAALDAELVGRIDSILNDYQPEPIYVTPPAPDCPAPVYSTIRVRDIAAEVNAALGSSVPPSSPADGSAISVTGLLGANDGGGNAESP